MRVIARWSQGDDPWDRFPYRVPLQTFGRGSYRPFKWYFEGESQVRVTSVDDVCAWLIECEYAHDDTLYGEDFILESVSGSLERMVRPFSQAKAEYVPHAGVDQEFQHYAYFGFLRTFTN